MNKTIERRNINENEIKKYPAYKDSVLSGWGDT
jgi:hypothetical protein